MKMRELGNVQNKGFAPDRKEKGMRSFAGRKLNVGLALVLAIGFAVSPSLVNAQDVTNGSATATVLQALVVAAPNALAFGNVYQGVAKSIANNNAAAGVFTIAGSGDAVISIYMQLPEFMATASGDDRMTVAFSTTDASVDSTANVNPAAFGSGWQNTNPHAFPTTTALGPDGDAAIFLGGRVIPSVNQKAGAYSADIVLTVAYTGA